MKRLVVLVGLPGSGKTAFRQRHPEWAVVSKDAIRWEIFRANDAPRHEDVVDRVFAATLVEVVDSDAETVCVDDLNLTRAVRRELIDVARLAGREPVAHVMPPAPLDELLDRARRNLDRLSLGNPDVAVTALSQDRFDAFVRSYEPVEPGEGFVRVEAGMLPEPVNPAPKRKRIARREPLPLFVP